MSLWAFTTLATLLLSTPCLGQSGGVEQWLRTTALPDTINYTVTKQLEADVTFDGKPEVLIAFENTTDANAPVPFFIVGKNSKRKYTVLLRNDELIQCRQCGGIVTDIGTFDVSRGSIITAAGPYGSRQRGEQYVGLRFDQKSRRWEIWAAGYNWYDSQDPTERVPGSNGDWCLQARDFPKRVFLDDTAPDAWSITSRFKDDRYYQVVSPRVTVKKSCPDADMPTAYLVKGDIIKSRFALKNSIGGDHIMQNDRTSGFIPKTALAVIAVDELADGQFTVDAPKAYFYSRPESVARQKAYVIKGNPLTCTYQVNGYSYCAYEKVNEAHETAVYYGFVKANALRRSVTYR